MAAIILPEKWHVQPSFPVEADRSHPLLRGAIDYVLAGPTGMSGFYSKDTSQLGSTLVVPGSTVDGVGRFTDASSSSQYEEIPTVITDVASNYDAFTLYCCGVIPPSGKGGGGSNFGSSRTVYGLRYDTSPFGVAIGVDASTPGVIAHPQMSGARSISLGNAVAGKHFDAFCWYDSVSNTWKGQLDNLAAVANASTTTLLSSAAVSPANRTGFSGSSSTPGSKTFLVGGAWWRVLDDGEKQALRENPWQVFVKDMPRIYSFSTGVSEFTGTLTGQESTFSAGTLTNNSSIALSGQQSSFSLGTVTPTFSVTLTGQEGTFTLGTLNYSSGSNVSVTLSGIESTFSTGTLTSALTVALSGQESTLESGNIIPAFLKELTGQGSSFASGTLTYNVTIPLDGLEGIFYPGTITYALTGGDVNVTLSGIEATFQTGTISILAGNLTLTQDDINAIVEALLTDPRMLTLPKWLALR